MPMIRSCAARGCSTLTMGERCLEHEPPAGDSATFPRGRPYQPVRSPSVSRTGTRSTRAIRIGQVIAVVLAALGLPASAVPADSRAAASGTYPTHTNITATVFWIGEPVGNGSTENNAVSAYDDRWLEHYGGVDDHKLCSPVSVLPEVRTPREPVLPRRTVRRLPRRRHPQSGPDARRPVGRRRIGSARCCDEAEQPVLTDEEQVGQDLTRVERDRPHLLRPGRGCRALPLRRCRLRLRERRPEAQKPPSSQCRNRCESGPERLPRLHRAEQRFKSGQLAVRRSERAPSRPLAARRHDSAGVLAVGGRRTQSRIVVAECEREAAPRRRCSARAWRDARAARSRAEGRCRDLPRAGSQPQGHTLRGEAFRGGDRRLDPSRHVLRTRSIGAIAGLIAFLQGRKEGSRPWSRPGPTRCLGSAPAASGSTSLPSAGSHRIGAGEMSSTPRRRLHESLFRWFMRPLHFHPVGA